MNKYEFIMKLYEVFGDDSTNEYEIIFVDNLNNKRLVKLCVSSSDFIVEKLLPFYKN